MHFNQLFIFLAFTIYNSRRHAHWILLRIRQVMRIRVHNILVPRALILVITPQIERKSRCRNSSNQGHENFRAATKIGSEKGYETTASAHYPGPTQSSRSVPGAGQKNQGSRDENGRESFENEHPAIMNGLF